MSLQDWANNGWLRSHKTSREEIGNLLEIVERDLKDAQGPGLSADGDLALHIMPHRSFALFSCIAKDSGRERISLITGHCKHFRLFLGKREMTTPTILTHAATKETQWNMIVWAGQLIQMLMSLSYLQRNSRMM
jgi:hypothetical protein